jgi:hypothetical protein
MANGSFGLSGIPTAPTTVGSAPNNPLSPVSAVVNSTAGFQAGDLIYNCAGDIAPPPGNYVATATFPINADLPTYIQNVSFGQEVAPIVNTGYAYKVRNTAKLTSGNIVVVYLISNSASANSNYPAYKIVDEAGTVIVAQTIIGTASFNSAQGNISVCALTGGGFAVAWFENTNSYVSYAIYSNTGTVVKAPATDTGAGSTAGATTFVQTYARPDGSYIIAYAITSAQLWYKVFSATGVQVYAWTNPGSNASGSNQFDIVVRSDNSFVIIFYNGGSQLHYQIRSATNVVSTATTAITNATSTNTSNWGGATLLAGDVTLVAWVSSGTPYYSSISAAGVASAGVVYPFYTLGAIAVSARPFTLADGNYILVYRTSTSTVSSPYGATLNYAILNTSHALVSGVNQPLYSVTTNSNAFFSFTQTTSYINLNYTPLSLNAGFSGAPPNNQTQINWIKFSPTTYQPIAASFVASSVGSSAAQPVSGYARSNSTPTGASFLASATSTVSATTTQSTSVTTLVSGQTVLDTSTSPYGLDTAMLSDGSVLVLYSVGGTIKLARISGAGVLLSTTTLATDAYTAINYGGVKIAILSSGKIVCAYFRTSPSNGITVQILSSAYALLTTISAGSGYNFSASTAGFDIAALTNDRFVLVYPETNGPQYNFYNSSGTNLGGAYFNSDSNPATMTCAGTPNGFYLVYYHPASGSLKYGFYQENSTNVFTTNGLVSQGTSSRFLNDLRAVTAPNGTVQYVYVNSSASNIAQSIHYSNASTSPVNSSWSSSSNFDSTSGLTLAITGSGDVATIHNSGTTSIKYIYTPASFTSGGDTTTYSVTITSLSINSNTSNLFFTACGMAGHNVLFLAANSTGQLTYLIFNPASYTYNLSLTAGVTPSNPVPVSTATGFSLVGVSSTAAPANGQGTVVINGPAQLNSSYPSTTAGQSFDFGNPVTFGAAGTISGRNVNLIGNV